MKPSDLIRMLQAQGWFVDRVSGSHYIMKHPVKRGRCVIPYHGKDLKPGTLSSILKQAEPD